MKRWIPILGLMSLGLTCLSLPAPAAVCAGTFVRQWGNADNSPGTGPNTFDSPQYIAFDSSGNFFVSNSGGLLGGTSARIEKFNSAGTFVNQWSNSPCSGTLPAGSPAGIGVDSSGNVYLVDSATSFINKYTNTGANIVASSVCDGVGFWTNKFFSPLGLAFNLSTNNFYVAESAGSRIHERSAAGTCVANFANGGPQACGTLGVAGSGNGEFNGAIGIAVAPAGSPNAGHVYVSEGGNARIQEFTATGTYVRQWPMTNPVGIAIDPAGNLYVVNQFPASIQVYSATGTFLTSFGGSGTGNGGMAFPTGIALDASGNVYVVDTGNNLVQEFSCAAATPSISPTPSSTRTVTVTWTPTASPSLTSTPTGTSTPTLTESPTGTPSQTDSPTATPSASASVTASATPSSTDTPSITASPTQSATLTETPTSTASATHSTTSTATPSATASATRTTTVTATVSPTFSFSRTPSPTGTISPTFTASPTPAPGEYLGPNPPDAGRAFVFPSPARGDRVNVVFNLLEPGQVKLDVWNARGDLVAGLREHKAAGLQLDQLPISNFAVGIYLYKVKFSYDSGASAETELQKFAVVR